MEALGYVIYSIYITTATAYSFDTLKLTWHQINKNSDFNSTRLIAVLTMSCLKSSHVHDSMGKNVAVCLEEKQMFRDTKNETEEVRVSLRGFSLNLWSGFVFKNLRLLVHKSWCPVN